MKTSKNLTKSPTAKSSAPKKRLQTVANGLEGLKEAVKGLKLQIPKLRELPSLSGIGATVEEKIKAVDQIQEDVANGLKCLADVRRLLSEYSDDRRKQRIVMAETKQNIAEMNSYLDSVLALDDVIYRQAAAIAYIKSVLSQDFKTREGAEESLHNLETRGLLVKANSGPITIGYVHYEVDKKFGMEAEDIAELNTVVSNFSSILKTLVYQQRQKDAKAAEDEATITLTDAMDDGLNGTCLLDVPPESYQDPAGNEKWRGGGKLLVRFTTDEVIPLKGIGSIESIVADMVRAGVRLPCHTLDKKGPPGSSDSFDRVRSAVMAKLGLNHEDAETYVNKEKVLWWFIRRADKARRSKKAVEKLKEEFSKKATCTLVQIFGLNGFDGHPENEIACLEFEGAFHQKERGSIYDLFFLATTSSDETGEVMIEVTEMPKHIEKLLGEFVGKQFPMKDNFSGCPAQLRRIFRAIRGQVEMSTEVSK